MFRISQYMQEIKNPTPLGPKRQPPGPVVIWNLIRRCNLTCKHCYSISADKDFPGELSTAEIFEVMDDLKTFGVPALILSGGEPLLRPDIDAISRHTKAMGFYVGISIDGVRDTHDRFRRKLGAYDASMAAVRLCHEHGIKVGLRFTMTQD